MELGREGNEGGRREEHGREVGRWKRSKEGEEQ